MSLKSAIVFSMIAPVAIVLNLACSFLQSPEAKVVERQVLTDVQIACVLEHELLQVQELEVACAIEHDSAPVINALLAAHKAAVRREMTARADAVFGKQSCDAGPDAR